MVVMVVILAMVVLWRWQWRWLHVCRGRLSVVNILVGFAGCKLTNL
jgi:hypothetical protein